MGLRTTDLPQPYTTSPWSNWESPWWDPWNQGGTSGPTAGQWGGAWWMDPSLSGDFGPGSSWWTFVQQQGEDPSNPLGLPWWLQPSNWESIIWQMGTIPSPAPEPPTPPQTQEPMPSGEGTGSGDTTANPEGTETTGEQPPSGGEGTQGNPYEWETTTGGRTSGGGLSPTDFLTLLALGGLGAVGPILAGTGGGIAGTNTEAGPQNVITLDPGQVEQPPVRYDESGNPVFTGEGVYQPPPPVQEVMPYFPEDVFGTPPDLGSQMNWPTNLPPGLTYSGPPPAEEVMPYGPGTGSGDTPAPGTKIPWGDLLGTLGSLLGGDKSGKGGLSGLGGGGYPEVGSNAMIQSLFGLPQLGGPVIVPPALFQLRR